MKNKKALGNLLLLLTAFIWGTAFVGQRAGMEHIGPFTFNAARMALSAAALGVPALLRARSDRREHGAGEGARKSRSLIGGVCCGVFLAAGSLLQQTGLVDTAAGKAGFITAMYLPLVPVIGALFFRKKNGALVWVAVLLGVVGLYLLCLNSRLRLQRGDALLCACALMFSGHILCCDHFAPREDPIRLSALQFVTAALISALAALPAETPDWAQLRSAAVPILYCGLLSGGLGYTMQMAAQKYTDPGPAALIMSMESVFAALAGALLLRERMSARELLGCAVMFLAVVLVQLPRRENKAP